MGGDLRVLHGYAINPTCAFVRIWNLRKASKALLSGNRSEPGFVMACRLMPGWRTASGRVDAQSRIHANSEGMERQPSALRRHKARRECSGCANHHLPPARCCLELFRREQCPEPCRAACEQLAVEPAAPWGTAAKRGKTHGRCLRLSRSGQR